MNNHAAAPPNGWTNANPPSRYEAYRYEIANNFVDNAALGGNAVGERGNPGCYTGGGLSDTPDRRVIYGAVINCSELDVRGNNNTPLPVLTFASFFLTEPVTSDGTIHAELTGLVEPGSVSSSVARDIVQLFR